MNGLCPPDGAWIECSDAIGSMAIANVCNYAAAHGVPRIANAQLMAAAPDLYEALEALMAFDGARGVYDARKAYDAKQAAEQALRKARGEI